MVNFRESDCMWCICKYPVVNLVGTGLELIQALNCDFQMNFRAFYSFFDNIFFKESSNHTVKLNPNQTKLKLK